MMVVTGISAFLIYTQVIFHSDFGRWPARVFFHDLVVALNILEPGLLKTKHGNEALTTTGQKCHLLLLFPKSPGHGLVSLGVSGATAIPKDDDFQDGDFGAIFEKVDNRGRLVQSVHT